MRSTLGACLVLSAAATACADGVHIAFDSDNPGGSGGNFVDGAVVIAEDDHGNPGPGASGGLGTSGAEGQSREAGGVSGAGGQSSGVGGAAGSPSAGGSDGGCTTGACDAGAQCGPGMACDAGIGCARDTDCESNVCSHGACQLPVGLKVQYAVGDPTMPSDNQIRPHFQLVNEGTSIIFLQGLTIRYWYTADTQGEQVGTCDSVSFGCGNTMFNTIVPLRPARSNADTYYEVAFGSGAGHLHPSQPSGSIEVRLTKQGGSNYDESNDYSHDATKTSLALWDKVTLYYRGVLVWGVEPGSNADAGL